MLHVARSPRSMTSATRIYCMYMTHLNTRSAPDSTRKYVLLWISSHPASFISILTTDKSCFFFFFLLQNDKKKKSLNTETRVLCIALLVRLLVEANTLKNGVQFPICRYALGYRQTERGLLIKLRHGILWRFMHGGDGTPQRDLNFGKTWCHYG